MKEENQARVAALLQDLMESPRSYLHSLDFSKDAGLLIAADRAFFRNALFLDGRVLQPGMTGAWVPLADIWAKTAGAAPRPLHFIFHVGHAGSTLLSRLLDEVPGVLGLREPETLRALAMTESAASDNMLDRIYALLARRFADSETVIVKATSICNFLAPRLLARHEGNRAVALTVSLRAHLANLLDKPQALDVTAFAPLRYAGLKSRLPGFALSLDKLSLGELVAFSWLAEVEALSHLKEGGQTLFVDFDAFLRDREICIGKILAHFGLPDAPGLAKSSIFGVYAKHPTFPFSPENRKRILEESAEAHADAIAAGERLAAELRKKFPALERAVKAVAST